MSKQIIIIDGYNAIHRVAAWKQEMNKSLEQGREALLRYCTRWIRTRGDVWTFYVVFDGESGIGNSRSQAGQGVRVVFTHSREEADDRILEILREYGERFRYTVISDDNYVRRNARSLGANIMPVSEFASVLASKREDRQLHIHSSKKTKRSGKQRRSKQHGDDKTLHPSTAKTITEDLMNEWL